MIVVSEVHHCAADKTFEAMNKFKSHYRYGESASKTRKDGKQFLFFDAIGNRVHEVSDDEISDENRNLSADVYFVRDDSIEYEPITDKIDNMDWHNLLDLMIRSDQRNAVIINEIKNDVNNGRICLVLAERKEHCRILHEKLLAKGIKSALLVSGTKDEGAVSLEGRQEIMIKAQNKEIEVIVATRSLAGESMDIPILSSLHLVNPSNNLQMSKQMVGRIRRVMKEGKPHPVVRDYVDEGCSYLVAIAKKRRNFYKKLGFTIFS